MTGLRSTPIFSILRLDHVAGLEVEEIALLLRLEARHAGDRAVERTSARRVAEARRSFERISGMVTLIRPECDS